MVGKIRPGILIVSYLPPFVIVVVEMCVFVCVRLLIQTGIFLKVTFIKKKLNFFFPEVFSLSNTFSNLIF